MVVLGERHARPYYLSVSGMSQSWAWTDASFEPGKPVPVMRLCAIAVASGQRVGVVIDVAASVFDVIKDRASQIAVGEIMAVVALMKELGHLLANTSLMLFVDNIGVIYILVNGASKHEDLGPLAFAHHIALNRWAIRPWVEHIASWSNIADGGSREGVTDTMAAECNIYLRSGSLPPLPNGFPFVSIKQWQEWM